jgi:hypothetical protein
VGLEVDELGEVWMHADSCAVERLRIAPLLREGKKADSFLRIRPAQRDEPAE